MFTNTCKTEQESGCIFSLKKCISTWITPYIDSVEKVTNNKTKP